MSIRMEAVLRLGGAFLIIVGSAVLGKEFGFNPLAWLLGALAAAFAIRLIIPNT